MGCYKKGQQNPDTSFSVLFATAKPNKEIIPKIQPQAAVRVFGWRCQRKILVRQSQAKIPPDLTHSQGKTSFWLQIAMRFFHGFSTAEVIFNKRPFFDGG